MKKGKARTQYHFPVLVEQDEDGVFIVSIPTLRGCRSYGDTLDDADAQYRGSRSALPGG